MERSHHYSTSQIAALTGIHPNTVRMYEEIGFISTPERKSNGYRIFTDEHLLQIKLIRLALQVEIVQNDLRKEALAIIRASAERSYHTALLLTEERMTHIERDRCEAEKAIEIVRSLLTNDRSPAPDIKLNRKATALYLDTTIDRLRNWEMNGLLTVKRTENGYRIYNAEDLKRLTIIKVLRDAKYSIVSIHRLLKSLELDPSLDIKESLDTPLPDEDILSVCDKLLSSLDIAQKNSLAMIAILQELQDPKN